MNDVLDSGATGAASLTLDLANVPTNLGRTAVLAGETWYWQAWYRDVDGGGTPTSNLSSAVGVTLTGPDEGDPEEGPRLIRARALLHIGAISPEPRASVASARSSTGH